MTQSQTQSSSLIALIAEACNTYADDPCIIQGDTTWTFGEVQETSRRIANGLIASGLKKGMRVAILSLNDAWAFVATIAIFRTGAIWVPINPRNSLDDNLGLLKRFGCDFLIYGEAFAPASDLIKKQHPEMLGVVAITDAGRGDPVISEWANLFSATDPGLQFDQGDIVTIPMTGGSTGIPKAVALSNRNMEAILTGVKDMSSPGQPIYLAAAPMTHVGGRIALTVLYRGGASVILPVIEPKLILDAIPRYGITEIFLPPTAIYALLDQPNVHDVDYSSLKHIFYGSAPMSIEKLKQAIKTFGPVMTGGFGQTEAPTLIAQLSPAEHFVDGEIAPDERLRSAGRATTSSRIGILDEELNELGRGEVGEIAVRGEFVSEGYFEDPDATAEIRKNGWHLTGDIGYVDLDGYLYIVDRKKDMIITGGFNVYSAEVERVISGLPGVHDCVVIGVPDDKWGEAVKAVVMPDSDTVLEPSTIIDECKKRLGGVKAPKSIDFVVDLPRNANGKVVKKDVRERYWKEAGRRI